MKLKGLKSPEHVQLKIFDDMKNNFHILLDIINFCIALSCGIIHDITADFNRFLFIVVHQKLIRACLEFFKEVSSEQGRNDNQFMALL